MTTAAKTTRRKAAKPLKAGRRFPIDGIATVEEAAVLFRCSRQHIYDMVRAKKLTPVRIGATNTDRTPIRFAWSYLHAVVEGRAKS
jgi:excisionase family DNA binding protein